MSLVGQDSLSLLS